MNARTKSLPAEYCPEHCTANKHICILTWLFTQCKRIKDQATSTVASSYFGILCPLHFQQELDISMATRTYLQQQGSAFPDSCQSICPTVAILGVRTTWPHCWFTSFLSLYHHCLFGDALTQLSGQQFGLVKVTQVLALPTHQLEEPKCLTYLTPWRATIKKKSILFTSTVCVSV